MFFYRAIFNLKTFSKKEPNKSIQEMKEFFSESGASISDMKIHYKNGDVEFWVATSPENKKTFEELAARQAEKLLLMTSSRGK